MFTKKIIGENTFLGKWELMRFEHVAPVDNTRYKIRIGTAKAMPILVYMD